MSSPGSAHLPKIPLRMPNVLLLRAPAENPPDPYELILQKDSHNPYSIPALETSFTNLPRLGALISDGPLTKDYAGVIITSKRSCEAWTTAINNSISSLPPHDETALSKVKTALETWRNVPFYVVGKGTATALECLDSPKLDVRGQDTGTAEQLAHFVLRDLKARGINGRTTLLYLTGDKNRDTVPKILCSGNESSSMMELEMLQVYETHGAMNFENDLQALMSQTPADLWWVVFFAPSSAGFAYPILQKRFRFTQNTSSDHNATSSLPRVRVGAIGRVTSTYLEQELNLHVDAIATKPSPEALAEAMFGTLL